ncbi:hypothetical protein [Novosphingobium album (ex Hu et al. 2023)]|uniref:Methyltransferase n=1 Tax=Novosphingobium album (ex Hu et al. 2023) TaxID=2930093 RepID=A0ABT0B4Z8_9SPHN|nr:hypothetical protein [Novosphingobium album (ex Hu et al. 2023)]MCJ2180162.1 hypothetical protein [Novosphingobium album (ex Hu et al. 2023)]
MVQNTSAAVMQQRSEPPDSLDDFPTPPWATRALCEFVARHLSSTPLNELTCREPCVNRGHMLRPLQEYFGHIDAFDIQDYGLGLPVVDYLLPLPLEVVHWTFMNAPFRLGEKFIGRALETSSCGVVAVCRSGFLEGETRYEELFSRRPPSFVLQFSERVVMLKGRLIRSGAPDPSKEKPKRKAGTASACSALIWAHDSSALKQFDWIGPCRRTLERDGDYPETPQGLAKLHREVGRGRG